MGGFHRWCELVRHLPQLLAISLENQMLTWSVLEDEEQLNFSASHCPEKGTVVGFSF